MTTTINKTTTTTKLLTIQEFADILRVDNSSVRRWIDQGTIKAVILPHVNERQTYRITREELDRVLGTVVSPTHKPTTHA